jgi:hypothetical protein
LVLLFFSKDFSDLSNFLDFLSFTGVSCLSDLSDLSSDLSAGADLGSETVGFLDSVALGDVTRLPPVAG